MTPSPADEIQCSNLSFNLICLLGRYSFVLHTLFLCYGDMSLYLTASWVPAPCDLLFEMGSHIYLHVMLAVKDHTYFLGLIYRCLLLVSYRCFPALGH